MPTGSRRRPVERTGLARLVRLPTSGVWILGLALVVVVVVACVMFLRSGSPDPDSSTEDAATAPGGNGAGEAADGPWDPYATTASGGRAATDAEQREWLPIVEQFTDRFLDPGAARSWITALSPLVTEQLAERLRHIDPANVPEGEYVSAAIEASGDTSADVTVTVRSATGEWALGVRVVDLPDDAVGWRVYAYDNRTSGDAA